MSRNNKKLLIYLAILLFPFFIVILKPSLLPPLKIKIVEVSVPIFKVVSMPFYEIKKLIYYHRTFEAYKKLKKEADTLKSRLVGMQELMEENSRLQQILEFKRKSLYSSIAANVIGRDPSLWNSSMIIDKGKEDGIKLGMPVVSPLGVVGKIAEVGKKASKVILLTDPQFSAAVMIQRSREIGLITGTLQGLCRLRYLSENSDVKVGDQVITAKMSFFFPESLMIGEVVEVYKSPRSPAMECLVKPAVDLSSIEEVLVIDRF